MPAAFVLSSEAPVLAPLEDLVALSTSFITSSSFGNCAEAVPASAPPNRIAILRFMPVSYMLALRQRAAPCGRGRCPPSPKIRGGQTTRCADRLHHNA